MLNYRSEGKGTTVLLLHAFPLSSFMWEQELEEIGRVAHVLTPDLPGFGGSARQKTPSIPVMAEEVGALLDHLRIHEPVVLGGLSMGGYVAFEFLRRYPKRVRGLMLFSTRAEADSPEVRASRLKTVEALKTEGFEAFAKKISRKLVGETTLKTKLHLADKVTAMIMANRADGVIDALYAMAERRDSSDLLEGIHEPCLIISGDEDVIIPPIQAIGMCQRIEGAQLHTVLKAGHLVNLECPQVFDLAVHDFLQSCGLNRPLPGESLPGGGFNGKKRTNAA